MSSSPLHIHFLNKGLARFRQVLESIKPNANSSGLSSSGPRSWQNNSPANVQTCDINARDHMGRTVLHLACTSLEPYALEFVKALLQHPAINVNAHDDESHWTALHRALWVGNLPAVVLLLQHADMDTGIKDYDGYTAFDLYSSTIEGTLPTPGAQDLFIWGSNRNATLGLGDAGDRVFPEQVDLERNLVEEKPGSHFYPVRFKSIHMSRLHTVAVTTEGSSNVRACGFGLGGRLGQGPLQHTQYRFAPLSHVAHLCVRAAALGQDHTLIVTTSSDVYSWGMNRFHQLGYVIETKGPGTEETSQSTAKRISGPLKKEIVEGVAASKIASACFTKTDVFTWGTNRGQLGYAKAAQPVQIIPRKVTAVTQQPVDLCMTDSALCVLLVTKDVLCFYADTHFRISFPAQVFPPSIAPYRPPQVTSKFASILKVTCAEETFAAMSSLGDVFSWTLPELETSSASHSITPKPQRIWALRRQMHGAKDVALGADGSVILCTESGHVFVRTRNIKQQANTSNKAFKFHRVPVLNRVVQVTASTSGAYAALRVDPVVKPVAVRGPSLADSLANLLPVLKPGIRDGIRTKENSKMVNGPVEEDEDEDVGGDIAMLRDFCEILAHRRENNSPLSHHPVTLGDPNGDIQIFTSSGFLLQAHSFIFHARSARMTDLLNGCVRRLAEGNIVLTSHMANFSSKTRLTIQGCDALTIILLLQYFYTDRIIGVGDRRIEVATRSNCSLLGVGLPVIRLQLQRLSSILGLQLLSDVLDSISKREPRPTLETHMLNHFKALQTFDSHGGAINHDTLLVLKDRTIKCHSAQLRVRSPIFASLFSDPDWTINRWKEGVITIDLRHLDWRAMECVVRYICGGSEEETLEDMTNTITTTEELIDYLFHVMAAANELLLDKLILVCSRAVARHINPGNVCHILSEATFLYATDLMDSLHDYITVNLEYLLERGLLRDLTPEVARNLSAFIQLRQSEKLPVTRSNCLTFNAMSKWAEWLALQDIPQPSLRSRPSVLKSPSKTGLHFSPTVSGSPTNKASLYDRKPHIAASPPQLASEETSSSPNPTTPPSTPAPIPWKGKGVDRTVERVDMLSIIAEAESSKRAATIPKTRVIGFQVEEHLKNDSAPSSWPPKLSQRDRKKSLQESQNLTSSLLSPKPSLITAQNSPWKPLSKSLHSSQSTSDNPPSALTQSLKGRASSSASLQPAKSSSLTTETSKSLVPVITPVRTSSSSDYAARRRPSGDPWAISTPSVTAPVSDGVSRGASFVAIQEQQREQIRDDKKIKKSLLDIQEEERAKQVEADFERWWASEEAKVRMEQEMVNQATAASAKSQEPGNRPRQPRSKARGRKPSKNSGARVSSTAAAGPVAMS
ncbi:hypothetical protein FRC02_004452 [Tulasnella sp. 418]|nr:hypothetical protein FRC02_004452 [Tulasnella sp. 418]